MFLSIDNDGNWKVFFIIITSLRTYWKMCWYLWLSPARAKSFILKWRGIILDIYLKWWRIQREKVLRLPKSFILIKTFPCQRKNNPQSYGLKSQRTSNCILAACARRQFLHCHFQRQLDTLRMLMPRQWTSLTNQWKPPILSGWAWPWTSLCSTTRSWTILLRLAN